MSEKCKVCGQLPIFIGERKLFCDKKTYSFGCNCYAVEGVEGQDDRQALQYCRDLYNEKMKGETSMDYDDYGSEAYEMAKADFEAEQEKKRAEAEALYQDAITTLLEQLGGGLPESVIRAALSSVVSSLSESLQSSVEKTLKAALQSEARQIMGTVCKAQMERLAKEAMREELKRVLADRIVTDDTSWSQKTVAIADVVRGQLNESLKKLGNREQGVGLVKSIVDEFLSQEVHKSAKQAVADFKKDLTEQVSKEAMKQIVSSVAQIVGKDKKLIALMQS